MCRGPRPAPGEMIVMATEMISVDAMVNGRRVVASVEARMSLSDFLRHRLGLTGTHVGCEQGVCGSCDRPGDGGGRPSWLRFAPHVDGGGVPTVAGLHEIPPGQRGDEAVGDEEAVQGG